MGSHFHGNALGGAERDIVGGQAEVVGQSVQAGREIELGNIAIPAGRAVAVGGDFTP